MADPEDGPLPSETLGALKGELPLNASNYSTKGLTILAAEQIFNRMVESDLRLLDAVFHALGDETRRQMLRRLTEGACSIGQLAEPFSISLAAASKHIKALESAGLIRREIRGRTHICRLEPEPLSRAQDWLRFYEQFWTDSLDRLDRLLREDDARILSPSKETKP